MIDDFPKGVAATWKVSFDQIEVENPSALSFLSLITFLDRQSVPKAILQGFQPDEWELTTQSLGTPQAYSFVTPGSGKETYDMHRLIQLAMQKRLHSSKSDKRWAMKALISLSQQFPDGDLPLGIFAMTFHLTH